MRRSRVSVFSAGVITAGLLAAMPATAGSAKVTNEVEVPGLRAGASVVRDIDGISHIKAQNQSDLFFLQGWVHADDRLFQMDVTRRQASGRLAELLGSAALPGDVQMRTLGLRRATERSLSAHSPETQSALRAYANGVNAWIARNRLPSQYAALRLTKVEPWTEVDSLTVVKALAFTLSFDLDIDRTTIAEAYRAVGAKASFDGAAAVSEDLYRFQPFRLAATVPDATGQPAGRGRTQAADGRPIPAVTERMAAGYLKRAQQAPMIAEALNREADRGSNSWVIGGRHTASGRPILASDPHLSVQTPTTLYPIHLAGGGFDVQGESIPGAPFVVLGQNRRMAWASTMNPLDVTDTFAEQIREDPNSPSGLSTVYQGKLEPVVALDETYKVNTRTAGQRDAIATVPTGGAIPAQTYIVPRRNGGPLLSLNAAARTAVSVQYVGFSPTRELDAFRLINTSADVKGFREALQFFDVGSQNFTYADVQGNIAYFTSGEAPIREDLQAGTIRGNPPYRLRDGGGGNEWLPVTRRQPHQSLPYEILPFDEMPQVVNPRAGYVVTGNNDPSGNTLDNNLVNQSRRGGGILYLGVVYNGFRGARITDLVKAAIRKGPITAADVVDQQADVTAVDGQFFAPYISAALRRARNSSTPELARLAKDPRIVEAIGRLSRWDHTYPTGIPEGYDAADPDGKLVAPSRREIDASVAATVYTLWRGRYVGNVLDAHIAQLSPQLPVPGDADSLKAVKQLLVDFDTRNGVGRSGIDFYAVPGITDAADRRDLLLLKSVAEALDLAAGETLAPAFGRSTDQSTYRWGKLHRITLASPIGSPFSIPSPGNRFTSPLPGLPGIPVDGGFSTVDVAGHNIRADAPDKFVVPLIPNRRFVAQPTAEGMRAVSALAGGTSEDLGSKFEQNLLAPYLTNDTYPVRLYPQDLTGAIDSVTRFVPARRG
jgi:penicillin G amidase